MATIANLKTAFTADTSGLKKGSQDAKAAIKDFEKVGENSLASIAQMFGVSTEQVRKFANAAKGAAASVAKALKVTDAQAVALTKSIGLAAGGIAGLSVATLVAAWKELNAEAEYYYQSMEGSIEKAGLDSYVSTLKGATLEMRDLAANTQKLMEMQTGWANFTNALKSAFAGSLGFSMTGKDGVMGAMEGLMAAKAAQDVAKAASEDARELQRLNIEIVQQEYKIYEYDQKIAEAKLAAKDANNDIATRQKAVAEAQKAINDRAAELAPIYQKLISLQTQYNEYTLTPLEDLKKLNSYKKAAADLVKQQADQSRELLELTTQIAKKAQEEAAARQASALAMQLMAEHKQLISGISGTTSATNAVAMPTLVVSPTVDKSGLDAIGDQIEQYVAEHPIDLDVKIKTQDAAARMAELNQTLSDMTAQIKASAITTLAETIGSAIGGSEDALATGVRGIAAILRQLGELCIAAGMASEAIKYLFSNPYMAIAAGAALVALSAAITAATSNISSQLSSYSGGITSGSTYTIGGSSVASTKTTDYGNITVTGTLKGDGDQLIAVINNTTNRNNYIR